MANDIFIAVAKERSFQKRIFSNPSFKIFNSNVSFYVDSE